MTIMKYSKIHYIANLFRGSNYKETVDIFNY